MELNTKETLLSTIKDGATILHAETELGSENDKKILTSIKEMQNFLNANESHEQELILQKKKFEHDVKLEKLKFEHAKEMDIKSKELEEKRIELEMQRINNESKKIALEEKKALNNKKNYFWDKAFKITGGVFKAVITLIPVGLYVWCYTNDTYYERYENGIVHHSAKEIMREVLKPIKLNK